MKRATCVLACAALLAALGASPALASPPEPADGHWEVAGFTEQGCYVLAMTGTFEGTGILCTEDATGKVNRIRFSGWVGGHHGSVTFKDVDFRPNGKELFTIVDGTGGLAGLHGQGVVRAVPAGNLVSGTYEGRIHFEP